MTTSMHVPGNPLQAVGVSLLHNALKTIGSIFQMYLGESLTFSGGHQMRGYSNIKAELQYGETF